MWTRKLLNPICICLAASALALANPGEASRDRFYRMQYPAALSGYRMSLDLAIQAADIKKEVVYLNNLATVFHALQKPDSTAAYLALARDACRGDAGLLTLVALNAFFAESGPAVGPEAVERLKGRLTPGEFSAALCAFGRMALKLGKPAEALPAFKRARKISDKHHLSASSAEALLGAARACQSLGKAEEALKNADASLAVFQARQYLYGIRRALKLKKEVLEAQGDREAAAAVQALLDRVRP